MTISESSAMRRTLEDSWRQRLEEARADYKKATDQYRKLLHDQPGGTRHSPNGALALARLAESEALAEYIRALRVFTELTVNGKMPEDRSAAGSDGL